MGREVRRVPLGFDWPQNKVWEGFLSPDKFDEDPCPDCKSGYSPQAQNLYDLWYGKIPFDPASTGSTPWRHDSPAVRAFAERNVGNAPDYYGTGEISIVREAQRLASLFNGQWSCHLSQDDVDALVAGGRLYDFTHDVVPGKGWQPKPTPVAPTAAEVNEWSLRSMGHDSINAHVVIKARCKREGVTDTCPTCDGHAGLERYEGQRAEAEAWEPTDPPEGEGWQLWETVSEGSPISPVFDSADGLAGWMSDPARGDRWVPGDVARKFVEEGWAPTGVLSAGHGFQSGVEAIGWNDKA
ncbi:hypothetical protein F2B00_03290 [Streptomyces parvus]|uniref:hypothetical protein n=1 Tax=Streptomyces parvus TaxID=66428 RepID=UPI001238F8FB|nr:hypothetical protein [Streptomyces parvus]KAA6203657.1 hypothetical protein F2B00_03290 [Streptomyces parvus]GGS42066.1 hypothetical protein GCM10010221_46210 [Streptomyces parvus]